MAQKAVEIVHEARMIQHQRKQHALIKSLSNNMQYYPKRLPDISDLKLLDYTITSRFSTYSQEREYVMFAAI